MQTIEIFPKAIWVDNISSIDNDLIVNYAYKLKFLDPEKRSPNNYLGYDKTIDSERWLSYYLTEEQITNGCSEIDKVRFFALLMGNKVLKQLNVNDGVSLFFDNCWLNINEVSEFTRPHIHPGTIITCTYYVQAPKNCGNLILQNPDNTIQWNFPPRLFRNRNKYTKIAEVIKPEDSKIVMFPANLMHYVEPNGNTENRISLTFNFLIKPTGTIKDPHYK